MKGVARGLGIAARVHSPTFTLVNEYGGGRLTLFHLDLYRLETREQILTAGLEEFLQPDGVAVIEWAESWFGKHPTSNIQHPTSIFWKCKSKLSARRNGRLFMTILALEFSSPQRSVAVLRAGDAAAAVEVSESGGNGTNVFAMIGAVLREAKLEREQIEVIAVGLGPGSYTGIRVAMSMAQGWQLAFADPVRDNNSQKVASTQRRLARGVRLLGIGTVECLAAQARAEKIFGRVNVVIDAQRNEIYMAGYEIAADGWREIEPLKILSPAEIKLRSDEGGIFIGPDATRWFPGGRILFPRAAMLAEMAAHRGDYAAGETLEPIYLRETNFAKVSPPTRLVK